MPVYVNSPFKRPRTVARKTVRRGGVKIEAMDGVITGPARGFVQTSGFYGRYGRRKSCCGDGELKFLDTAQSTTVPAAAGSVYTNLVVIPQGDTESMRNGRKVMLKSVSIRGRIYIQPQANSANTSDIIRILLVQDKQANGVAFTPPMVLAGTPDYLAYRNLANTSRFNILFDKSISLNSLGGVATDSFESVKTFTINRKLKIPMEYDASATTGAIGTQRSNSLAVMAIAENGALSNIQYQARVRYSDN